MLYDPYLGAKDDKLDNIEVDEESFREDLERDSVHSSMSERPPPGTGRSSMEMRSGLSHEERYAQLQRQSQRRSSVETHQTV